MIQSSQRVGLPGIGDFILFKGKLDLVITKMSRGLFFVFNGQGITCVTYISILLHAKQGQGRGCLLSKTNFG